MPPDERDPAQSVASVALLVNLMCACASDSLGLGARQLGKGGVSTPSTHRISSINMVFYGALVTNDYAKTSPLRRPSWSEPSCRARSSEPWGTFQARK